jgi:hypothetical protein
MEHSLRRSRIAPALAAAAAALAVVVPSAQAAADPTGGVCDGQSLVQPFAAIGDQASYVLAPGGNFEGDAASSWSLTGGAAVQDGNEPSQVGGAADGKSLRLPAGSSAASAQLCVTWDYPWMRMFARNTGDPASRLLVTVNYKDPLGLKHNVPVGLIAADGTWSLSDQIPTMAGKLGTSMSLRLTPVGNGDWTVDDVYVDPYCRG